MDVLYCNIGTYRPNTDHTFSTPFLSSLGARFIYVLYRSNIGGLIWQRRPALRLPYVYPTLRKYCARVHMHRACTARLALA